MIPFTIQAMVHSLKAQDEVTIISHTDNNNVVAEYKGQRCTAVFNVFNGLYYVDNIYGNLKQQTQEYYRKKADFTYNNSRYQIDVSRVIVQGYAALLARTATDEMNRLDYGNGLAIDKAMDFYDIT